MRRVIVAVRPVVCPLCGGRFARFLEQGEPPRPRARCPGCGSLERHRLLWLWLQFNFQASASPRTLLHFAPERCLASQLRESVGGGYVSADLIEPADIRLDITRLPFRSGSLNAIVCNHVLEHIPDDRAAMDELHRVMAVGGWGTFDVPVDLARATTDEDPSADRDERIRRFGQHDHARQYGRDYPSRLIAAGFEVTADAFASRLSRRGARRFGIPRSRVVWHARKVAPIDPVMDRASSLEASA